MNIIICVSVYLTLFNVVWTLDQILSNMSILLDTLFPLLQMSFWIDS